MSEEIPQKVYESPALSLKSEIYPERFNCRVPLKIRMIKNVISDFPFKNVKAAKNTEYYVWVNMNGAIAAILDNGETLGIKPNECEIIAWHETGVL